MTIDKKLIEDKMKKALDALHKDFSGLRTGRAATSMLDSITVDVYGSRMPLNQVGSVSAPDAQTLSVSVWDKGSIAAVEKAIRESELGLNPQSNGTLIRIPVPPLSEERRVEICKIASKYAEGAKVSVRNARHEGMEMIKKAEKDKTISEDDAKREHDEIQKLTDKYVSEVSELLKVKEADIKTV
ncbi:MAG: ribosome recycling factor [Alphaproteobacteria bacterium]|jgi:ribosome recycling factor|nr:ribosome recycling factor [Alphaproteobacteria bacterium]MCV6599761.1 ribosome recycling factor [Alphaproteobacteria bacterium]